MTRPLNLATSQRPYLFVLSIFFLSLAACSSTREWPADSNSTLSESQCKLCHGSTENAAPPPDASGNTATTSRGVGAHQTHLLASNRLSTAMTCDMCHTTPTTMDHINGVAEVTFGELAKGNTAEVRRNLDPQWDATTLTCTNTYCHGATVTFGSNTSPSWTLVDGSQIACGSCHGIPPYSHIPGWQCRQCHDNTVNGENTVITNPANHINGRINFSEAE